MKNKSTLSWVVLVLILFGGLLLTYSNHFHNPFHFDDSHTTVSNIYIRDLSHWKEYFTDTRTVSSLPSNQIYRPLFTLSLAVDYWLGKGTMDSFPFHVSMFFWYVIQCVLMFFMFRKILEKISVNNNFISEYASRISLFITGLYAFHTVNAETINYITSRSDSYSTLWIIAGLVTYMYFPKLRKTYLYFLPVIIATGFKQTALMFAPLLFVYCFLFENEENEEENQLKHLLNSSVSALKKSWAAFLLCAILYWFQARMTPPSFVPAYLPVFNYMITQTYVALLYFFSFFLPIHLSADTDLSGFSTMYDLRFIAGFAFILLMLQVVFLTYRKPLFKPIAFGILWWFIALVPTSTFFPLSEMMNDHRMFFPNAGLVLSVGLTFVLLIHYVFRNSQIRFSVPLLLSGLILFSAYGYGTFQRNHIWSNGDLLWKDVTEKSPKNGRGWMNYGLGLMSKGDYAGAEQVFKKAEEFVPRYSYLHINLGVLKEALGDTLAAEQYFKNGVAYGFDNPETFYFYGRFLQRRKRYDEAIGVLQKSLQLSEGHLYSRDLLMTIYYEQGDKANLTAMINSTLGLQPTEETALYYKNITENNKTELQASEDAVKAKPTPNGYLNLSLQYYNAGKFEDCVRTAEEALKLNPDYAEAYNNICTAYNALKLWDKAIAAGEKALKLKGDFSLARNNLNYAISQKNLENKK